MRSALGVEFPRRDHFRDSNDVDFTKDLAKSFADQCKSRLTSELSNATLFKHLERRKWLLFTFAKFILRRTMNLTFPNAFPGNRVAICRWDRVSTTLYLELSNVAWRLPSTTTVDEWIRFNSNHMGLSRTVSEIIGDFSRKSQFFSSHPCILRPCWRSSPWNWVYRRSESKNYNDSDTRPRKKFDDIFSNLDTIHQRDGQTDTGRQQRPRLHIASRGKKTQGTSNKQCEKEQTGTNRTVVYQTFSQKLKTF